MDAKKPVLFISHSGVLAAIALLFSRPFAVSFPLYGFFVAGGWAGDFCGGGVG